MGAFVLPKVYWVGYSEINEDGLDSYLRDTGNSEFAGSIAAARSAGISSAEILCSMFAKLCYKALTRGKNDNITRVRDIEGNIEACFDSGHGSVFEHVAFSFVITNCSRIATHELVRHRAGTAFSQTSGRYVRGDRLDLILDPILEPIGHDVEDLRKLIEDHYCRLVDLSGLNGRDGIRRGLARRSGRGFEKVTEGEITVWTERLGLPKNCEMDFTKKKKLTSALRRILPNGQANEIAFSVNLRSLRHIVQIRTSRHSEWEIRYIFAQVYELIKDKFPKVFFGAKVEDHEGIIEVSGMKMQPYETKEN